MKDDIINEKNLTQKINCLIIHFCKEYWDKLPFKSDHIFDTDKSIHNNPTNCIKCGKSAIEWQEECIKEFKEMPEGDNFIKQTQIQINKISDATPL